MSTTVEVEARGLSVVLEGLYVRLCAWDAIVMCVLLCFIIIKPMLGNRYGPGVIP